MNVWIDIDKEAEESAQRVVSNAWDGDEWCEDGSIRQDIINLNKKIDILVKSIAEVDSLEVLKKKLDVLEEVYNE